MRPSPPPSPCQRCGACCRNGPPALHAADRPLVLSGRLKLKHLLTLRRGEIVSDNVAGRLVALEAELVKLRPGADGRGCLFYKEDVGCGVYADRPCECRLLDCRATAALTAMYAQDRLARADCLPEGDPRRGLIQAHAEGCDPGRAARLAAAARQGDRRAAADLAAMVRFDAAFRELCQPRAGIAPGELPFLFGRPLSDLVEALAGLPLPFPSADGR